MANLGRTMHGFWWALQDLGVPPAVAWFTTYLVIWGGFLGLIRVLQWLDER